MKSFSGFGNNTNFASVDTPVKGVVATNPNPMQSATVTTMTSSQIEEHVYQFLLSGKSTEWGFSKADCVLKFKNMISENDINKAVESLLDDARIYDTGDEVHFKAIE